MVQESATRSVLRFGLVILCLSGFDTRGRAVLSVRRWSVTPSKQLHVRYTGRVNDKATYRLLCLIQDSRYCSVGRGSLLSVQRLGGDLRRSGGGEEESKPVTAQPPSDLSLALTINPSRGRLVASAKFKSSTRSIDTSDSLVTSITTNIQIDLDHSEPAGNIMPKTVRTRTFASRKVNRASWPTLFRLSRNRMLRPLSRRMIGPRRMPGTALDHLCFVLVAQLDGYVLIRGELKTSSTRVVSCERMISRAGIGLLTSSSEQAWNVQVWVHTVHREQSDAFGTDVRT